MKRERYPDVPQEWLERAAGYTARRKELKLEGEDNAPSSFIPGYRSRVFVPYDHARLLNHFKDLYNAPAVINLPSNDPEVTRQKIKATSRVGEQLWYRDRERILAEIDTQLQKNGLQARFLYEILERALAGGMTSFEWRGQGAQPDDPSFFAVPELDHVIDTFFPGLRNDDFIRDELAVIASWFEHPRRHYPTGFGIKADGLRAVVDLLDGIFGTNIGALDAATSVYNELFRDRLRGLTPQEAMKLPDLFSKGYAIVRTDRRQDKNKPVISGTWDDVNREPALGNAEVAENEPVYKDVGVHAMRSFLRDAPPIVQRAHLQNLIRAELRIPLPPGETWHNRFSEVGRYFSLHEDAPQSAWDAARDIPAWKTHQELLPEVDWTRVDKIFWQDQ